MSERLWRGQWYINEKAITVMLQVENKFPERSVYKHCQSGSSNHCQTLSDGNNANAITEPEKAGPHFCLAKPQKHRASPEEMTSPFLTAKQWYES